MVTYLRLARIKTIAFLLFLFLGTQVNGQICPQTINTIAGTGVSVYNGDGIPATAANLYMPTGLKTDAAGNIFFSDNNSTKIRMISPGGIISAIAGTGAFIYGGDGGPATAASFSQAVSIAVDGSGNIYVSDRFSNRIRKIDRVSGIINTVVGNGISGFSGDGGPASSAQLNKPYGLAFDAAGNLYIGDFGNFRIRKVDAVTGVISTIAGNGTFGFSGDGGPAMAAQIQAAFGIYVDGPGNIYFTDVFNYRLRKINTSGVISTIAGTGIMGYSGDGGPATAADLGEANDVVADGTGNIYFTDDYNNVVRKIDGSGIITTVAGVGVGAYSGDGGPATAAGVDRPRGIGLDNSGNLVIVDMINNRLRKVSLKNAAVSFTGGTTQNLFVCRNSTGNSIDALLEIKDADAGQTETWSVATAPSNGTVSAAYTTTSTGSTITPTGLFYTPNPGYTGTDVIKIKVIDCSGTPAFTTINVTVTASTYAGVITGPVNVCTGATITLSNIVSGGSWTADNTNTIVSPAGVVSGIAPGTSVIYYKIINSCGAASVNTTITVTASPSGITGPVSVCTGNIVALTDATGGGAWSTGNSAVATAGPTTGYINGISAGTATITYKIGGLCATTMTMTVDPPLPAITGTGSMCPGAKLTLSNAISGGTWASADGNVTVGSGSGLVTGVTDGPATVTYTATNGCKALATVTVHPAAKPITGLTDLCGGGTIGYAATADAPKGIWTSSLVTVNTTGMVTAYPAGVGTVTYTLPTGCLTTATLTVYPVPGIITGPVAVCVDGLINLSDSTSGGVWSTTDADILIDAPTGAVVGMTPGTAFVTYTMPTGCNVTTLITVYDNPAVITGTAEACPGNTATLSDATPGGAWSISSGGVATIDPVMGIVSGAVPGTTMVTYTTGTGCTATKMFTVLPVPAVYSMAGGGSFCSGTTGVHVRLSGSATGVDYELRKSTVPVAVMPGTGSFLDFGLTTVTDLSYTVVATNVVTGCMSNMAGSVPVTMEPSKVPAVKIITIPALTVCEGTSVSLIASDVDGGSSPTFEWRVNSKVVGTGTSSYSYVPVNGDVIGITMVSNATCASPTTAFAYETMTVVTPVDPVIKVTADPGLTVTKGDLIKFTATVTNSVPGVTYQWFLNGSPMPGQTNAILTANNFNNYDKITVKVNSNGMCNTSATSDVMQVLVKEIEIDYTGVQQLHSADISIYPNPNTGSFAVTGKIGTVDEAVTLELTDLLGKVVYKSNTIAKNGVLNATVQLNNKIANGTYLLNVRSSVGSNVFHIVVTQ